MNIKLLITAVKKSGITPTIIFDVERSVSRDDDILGIVRGLSKDLALYCRCILVLSEANAVLNKYQQILKALKDHPEGVSPEYFHNEEHKGVNLSHPEAVGAAMKSVNAIVYRKDLRKYMLMSGAHRKALDSYEPIVTK